MSRRDQGIWTDDQLWKPAYQSNDHVYLVVVLLSGGIKRLDDQLRVRIAPAIAEEEIVDGQPISKRQIRIPAPKVVHSRVGPNILVRRTMSNAAQTPRCRLAQMNDQSRVTQSGVQHPSEEHEQIAQEVRGCVCISIDV
jgi:hypothetical protein